MCGICGYIAENRIDDSVLEMMNNSMMHRGPDDAGIWNEQQYGYAIGLAQRRLSIMDLSPSGHQPMFSADKKICIVFNGEIYNFWEVRAELEQKGYTFRSQCDTEVLLYAYDYWGREFLGRINGMFALAIYDRKQGQLLLARDRMGKKPLYVYQKDATFAFASELKPIMLFPEFYKEIRSEVLARYLCVKYINEPDTIFKDTWKLGAGEYLVWKKGEIHKDYYWSLQERWNTLSGQLVTDYGEAKQNLTDLLRDAIARRLVADVPVGAFLSGGIDSTLVTALAAEVSEKKVKTYCIGFQEKKYNEAEYARKIAAYLGTEHTELYVSEQDVFRMMDRLSFYYDEPFADPSQVSTMLVSELARKDITVALSGDGGDELFCGYELYDSLRKRQKSDIMAGMGYHILKPLHLLDRMPESIRGVLENRNPDYKVQYYLTKFENLVYGLFRDKMLPIKSEREKWFQNHNWQEKGMLLDMSGFLPNEILTKVDRATMKYALEGRSPILDYRVVEYSFRLPHAFKYRDGVKKYILKDILYEKVPQSLLDRPKQGFDVPVEKWMRGILREKILEYSTTDYLNRQGIFEPEATQSFLNQYLNGTGETYRHIVWGYFIFQEWYAEYMR